MRDVVFFCRDRGGIEEHTSFNARGSDRAFHCAAPTLARARPTIDCRKLLPPRSPTAPVRPGHPHSPAVLPLLFHNERETLRTRSLRFTGSSPIDRISSALRGPTTCPDSTKRATVTQQRPGISLCYRVPYDQGTDSIVGQFANGTRRGL